METAKQVAPEIDRLVWAVNETVEDEHGRWLAEASQKAGLAGPELGGSFAEFLLAGRLTIDIATRRMPYRPATEVNAWLADLVERGQILEKDGNLSAAHRILPFLEGMLELRESVTADMWAGQESGVDIAAMGASLIIGQVTDDFVVAAAHRALPDPQDRHRLLHHRLITLRYIRQHAHVQAWQRRDLTAGQVVVMTRLWLAEDIEPDDPELSSLVEVGYVEEERRKLTAVGDVVRGKIEDDTNRLTQTFFDVLDGGSAEEFSAALRILPGSSSRH